MIHYHLIDYCIRHISNVFVIGLIVPRTEPLFTLSSYSEVAHSVSVSPFVAGMGYIDGSLDLHNSHSFSGEAPCYTRLGPCHQRCYPHFCTLGGQHRPLHCLPYTLRTCSGGKGSRCFQASQSLWSSVHSTWSVSLGSLFCISEHWEGVREGARVPV